MALRGYFQRKPTLKAAYEAFLAAPGETLSLDDLVVVLYGEGRHTPLWAASARSNAIKVLSRMRFILEQQTGKAGWLVKVSRGKRSETTWRLYAPERSVGSAEQGLAGARVVACEPVRSLLEYRK